MANSSFLVLHQLRLRNMENDYYENQYMNANTNTNNVVIDKNMPTVIFKQIYVRRPKNNLAFKKFVYRLKNDKIVNLMDLKHNETYIIKREGKRIFCFFGVKIV